MGLLDDVFGKETINLLKEQLAEKVNEVARAESQIAQAKLNLTEQEKQLAAVKAAVSDREVFIKSLKSVLDEKQFENNRQVSELEALRVAALDRKVQAKIIVSNLQASIAKAEAETLAAVTARESIERDWREARDSHDVKDRLYQEREARLVEKSGILHSERQKFQKLAADLHSREQRWMNDIEPQLLKYEAHFSIDSRELQLQETRSLIEIRRFSLESRESDLTRRANLLTNLKTELSHQKSEQAAKVHKLEDWARELFALQGRVNRLDVEGKKLETEKKEIQSREESSRALYLEQLADLRRQRSALKGLENDLTQRESYLKARERDVNREESKLALIKDKNLELRKEQRRLTSLSESLEASNRESLSRIKRLTKKHELLQPSYGVIQERSKSPGTIGKINSSLTNAKVLSWLLENGDPDTAEIENGWLGSTGNGPWHDQALEAGLKELGYQFYPMPDDELEYLIVGRKGWSRKDLLAQIEAREGLPLRIYSQEMFFAKLIMGKDPFDAGDDELLSAFAADHPALQFLMSLPEPWPSVTSDEPEYIVEVHSEDFGVSESPLHILGYRVGATSDLSATRRRKILTECFESRLTFSKDSKEAYIAKWGRESGAQRLYRMAAHIKSLADGLVGKDYRKPQSRADWISDLNWLKKKYFANYRIRFSWPGV